MIKKNKLKSIQLKNKLKYKPQIKNKKRLKKVLIQLNQEIQIFQKRITKIYLLQHL